MPPQRALETVGRRLHEQYEKWQPKVKKCFCDNRYYVWTRSRLYLCGKVISNLIITTIYLTICRRATRSPWILLLMKSGNFAQHVESMRSQSEYFSITMDMVYQNHHPMMKFGYLTRSPFLLKLLSQSFCNIYFFLLDIWFRVIHSISHCGSVTWTLG